MSRRLLEPGSLVIGDLHLDPVDPQDCGRLVDWLSELEAPALVVLGDLFDAWVGPAHETTPGARSVIEALAALTVRGTEVHLLHGNRDFLLGASFEGDSGAVVHPEGLDGLLEDGTRVSIVHGDELCTRDRSYQRLRRVTRSAVVRELAPRVPLGIAGAVARRLRRASVQAVASKPSDEKRMQEQACRQLARERGAAVVVCGHAHRAQDLQLSDGPRWIVLDAFGDARDQLRIGERGELFLGASGARAPLGSEHAPL